MSDFSGLPYVCPYCNREFKGTESRPILEAHVKKCSRRRRPGALVKTAIKMGAVPHVDSKVT